MSSSRRVVRVRRRGGPTAPALQLPAWTSVLAVVAHPDDESFGLGALLTEFVHRGAQVGVLCFTHGDASTLHGVPGELHSIRASEIAEAARILGVSAVELRDHPDGALSDVPLPLLAADVEAVARAQSAQALVVFDTTGITGHRDHRWATRAATAAGAVLDLPVLAWTLPEPVADTLNLELGTTFRGRPGDRIDLVVTVDRTRQLPAVDAHPSQAVPAAPLWRRLDLLAAHEHLRLLHPLSGPVAVQVMFTPDCPNWPLAYDNLARALADSGRPDEDVALTCITDQAQAQARDFTGSPTILLDGVDPFADPHAGVGLACRLYATPDGRRGAPTSAQISAALSASRRA